MANQQTGHYQLSQWAAADRILMADFNSDNAKIDAAMKALADAVAAKADGADVEALAETVAGKGNCFIEQKTYTGSSKSGSSNKVSVTFSKTPLLIFIIGNGNLVLAAQGASGSVGNQSGTPTMSWSGNKVSWYHTDNYEYHMNKSGVTYTVYAVML